MNLWNKLIIFNNALPGTVRFINNLSNSILKQYDYLPYVGHRLKMFEDHRTYNLGSQPSREVTMLVPFQVLLLGEFHDCLNGLIWGREGRQWPWWKTSLRPVAMETMAPSAREGSHDATRFRKPMLRHLFSSRFFFFLLYFVYSFNYIATASTQLMKLLHT